MTNYCPFNKYKYIFGKPNEGIHKYRFLNSAIIDYILTIFISIITTYFTNKPLVLTTIFWFLLGILLHILFGVDTQVIKYIGISCNK